MAVQGRGYYGIGAAKKDFGFSSNLTLPLSGGYSSGWSQSDAMPTEGHSDKTRASFTVDREGKVRRIGYQMSIPMDSILPVCKFSIFLQLQVEYRDGAGSKKGKSWRNRLSGFFKREKNPKESEEEGKKDTGSKKSKGKKKASEAPPKPKLETATGNSTVGAPPTFLHSVR